MKKIIPYIIALCYIILGLIAFSILDIILVFLCPRFYSNALFITTFAVGGVIAGTMAYMGGLSYSKEKNEWSRWSLVLLIAGIGLLFFFLLAKLEGGEYEAAFKAYGITLTLSMLMFVKGKIE